MTIKLQRKIIAATLAIAVSLVPSAPAGAQDKVVATGKARFEKHCASCHGVDGRGNGPVAEALRRKPADLTRLAARNDGEFPFWFVYQTIDGRGMPAAHGTREMPVWGKEFGQDIVGLSQETYARGRILEVIVYLRSIQEKVAR